MAACSIQLAPAMLSAIARWAAQDAMTGEEFILAAISEKLAREEDFAGLVAEGVQRAIDQISQRPVSGRPCAWVEYAT